MKNLFKLFIGLLILTIFACEGTKLEDPQPFVLTPKAADATNITTTSFQANWGEINDSVSYLLEVAMDEGFDDKLIGYENKMIDTLFAEVTGLTPNTTYYYRLAAVKDTLISDYSNVISVTTDRVRTFITAPVAIAASNVAETSFQSNWESVEGITVYLLELAFDEAFTSFVTGYEEGRQVSGTSFEIVGLDAGTTYYYRLKAITTTDASDYSNIISVSTLTTKSIAAPLAINANNISISSFKANWNSVSDASSYLLEVATDEAFSSLVTGYPKTINSTSTTVSGLISGTTYYYRVKAVGASGSSNPSNFIAVTTSLSPPVTTTATEVISTSFQANWSAVTGASSYLLEVATDNGFTNLVTGFDGKEVTGTTDGVSGLVTNTTYYYRVKAKNGNTTSDYSNITSVTTP